MPEVLGESSLDSGFEPARTTAETREVAAAQVVDLLHITHSAEVVAEYARAMERGATFPPISVVRVGRRYVVADGHKRLLASRSLGEERLIVEVWPWSRLVADLARQLGRFLQRAARACTGPFRGAPGRRETIAFLRSTTLHWVRLVRSLASLVLTSRRRH